MSKGYMAKVAEALGVEIGEVFKISKENSNEKFTKYFRITHDNIEESEYQFVYVIKPEARTGEFYRAVIIQSCFVR